MHAILKLLKEYTPLIKNVWSNGLFDDFTSRYFQLINRSSDFANEIHWDYFTDSDNHILIDSFDRVFNASNVSNAGHINKMLHFDYKTLLPGLLQVEDRMSMAHGIESRVPFLEPKIAEFAATLPPSIKFSDGKMKNILKTSFPTKIPDTIMNRTDKMGFTVPLQEWFAQYDCKKFLIETFSNSAGNNSEYLNYDAIINNIHMGNSKFSRKIWGLLSLELWQQNIQSLFLQEQRGTHNEQ